MDLLGQFLMSCPSMKAIGDRTMKLSECYYIEDLNESFDSEMYYYVKDGRIECLSRSQVVFVVNEKMSGYNWCILEYDFLRRKNVPGEIRTDELSNSEDDFLDVKKADLLKRLDDMRANKEELQKEIDRISREIEEIEKKDITVRVSH